MARGERIPVWIKTKGGYVQDLMRQQVLVKIINQRKDHLKPKRIYEALMVQLNNKVNLDLKQSQNQH